VPTDPKNKPIGLHKKGPKKITGSDGKKHRDVAQPTSAAGQQLPRDPQKIPTVKIFPENWVLRDSTFIWEDYRPKVRQNLEYSWAE
jgi:hypothetical protein